jgi:hypothetical protein
MFHHMFEPSLGAAALLAAPALARKPEKLRDQQLTQLLQGFPDADSAAGQDA